MALGLVVLQLEFPKEHLFWVIFLSATVKYSESSSKQSSWNFSLNITPEDSNACAMNYLDKHQLECVCLPIIYFSILVAGKLFQHADRRNSFSIGGMSNYHQQPNQIYCNHWLTVESSPLDLHPLAWGWPLKECFSITSGDSWVREHVPAYRHTHRHADFPRPGAAQSDFRNSNLWAGGQSMHRRGSPRDSDIHPPLFDSYRVA